MRLSSLVRASTLALVLIGFTTAAQADPITYQISSIASGTIGGTSFSNVLVTLTGAGNTANIVSLFGFAFAEPITTTVTIPGIGTATITDPTEIFSTAIPVVIETGFPNVPYVIIGRIDNPPALDSLTGIGGVGSAALLGYNLATPIGPITTSPGGIEFILPCSVPGHDPCLSTTMGLLSFTSAISPTTQGTFSAALQPVPEPTSLFLLGSGVAAVFGRSRFRARGDKARS